MKTPMNTDVDETTIQPFKDSLRGALLRPGDDHYETSRRVGSTSTF